MRELKFRVWDNLKKEWLKNKVYHFNLFCNEIGIGEFRLNQHPEGFTIQQYTGLKDKHGKDIYEGDIVTYQQPYRAYRLTHPATTDSYRTIKAPVVYNQDDFTYEIDGYALGTPMIKTRKDIEVVGNIFENPELLEQTALA